MNPDEFKATMIDNNAHNTIEEVTLVVQNRDVIRDRVSAWELVNACTAHFTNKGVPLHVEVLHMIIPGFGWRPDVKINVLEKEEEELRRVTVECGCMRVYVEFYLVV
jgi:hypothetical protein